MTFRLFTSPFFFFVFCVRRRIDTRQTSAPISAAQCNFILFFCAFFSFEFLFSLLTFHFLRVIPERRKNNAVGAPFAFDLSPYLFVLFGLVRGPLDARAE